MYFKLCFYIANATNVFQSSILDILRERGIPHQISPSTYHPWCYSVVSPVLRSSRYIVYIRDVPIWYKIHIGFIDSGIENIFLYSVYSFIVSSYMVYLLYCY